MLRLWQNLKNDKPPPLATEQETTHTAPRQVLNKAGIIVTDGLREAITRCRSKVQRIARECRRNNRRYRDPEFDILDDREKCLHGLKRDSGPTYYPSDALRVNQIFEKPEFFISGATASDISQGAIGDCWFLSGLSLIATAGLIEKICVERDEKVGVYGFIFWRDAGWMDVIVDDLLFVQIPKWRELDENTRVLYKYDQDAYMKQARRGSKILYFSKSATDNETWVPLIEKAYAKLHGDYAALDGGLSHEAIEDLSGAVSNWMYIRDTLDPDRFWNEELLKANQDRLFACSIINAALVNDDGRRWRDPLNGLVAQHAYSVVKAMEYNGMKFVKIRNPWGMYEWQGRWSDGSKEWTGEWLDALKALDYSFGNDGEFLMEYSDFLNTWDSVERCRLFDGSWALSQLWLQVGLGDFPRPVGYGDVSFTISVSHNTSAVIMLSQIDTRYFSGVESPYKFSLRFLIFKAGEKEPIASSYHDALWRRSVNVEVELEAGNYVVQVRVDREPPPSSTTPVPNPTDPTAASTSTINTLSRKMVQKKAEKLISTSIAANFRASDYNEQMPLADDLYYGIDLTEMELEMYALKNKFKEEKKAAFAPKVEEVKDDSAEKVKEDEVKPVETVSPAVEEKKGEDGEKTESGTEEWSNVDVKSEASKQDDLEKPMIGSIPPDTHPSGSGSGSGSGPTTSCSATLSAAPTVVVVTEPVGATIPPKEKEEKEQEKEAEVKSVERAPSPSPPQVAEVKVIEAVTVATTVTENPSLHEGILCDGCGGPVIGSRFHCLDITCPDYDLCDKCMKIGAHNPAHRMVEIKDPADRNHFSSRPPFATDEDAVTIGLKVYASKDCQVTIRGQLRHNQVVRNYVTTPQII